MGTHSVFQPPFLSFKMGTHTVFPPPFLPFKMGEAGGGMSRRSPSETKTFASQLRHNLTPAEARLWARLRGHQMRDIHFRKQHAIGNYIVDFCAIRKKLIIELDGSQHLDQADYDAQRTEFLESMGDRVLRFWNHAVMNEIDSVLRAIDLAIEEDDQ
jgi:very-short-patch-repair endonuclease